MRELIFLGDSHKVISAFPRPVKQRAGFELQAVQRGYAPADFKPMPIIGSGVEELRLWDGSGTYRVIYTARLKDAVYVLHAFQKKTQGTAERDINKARERFLQLMKERR